MLGIKPRGRVTFAIDGDQVQLLPAKFTLKAGYGSVTSGKHPEDFDERIDDTNRGARCRDPVRLGQAVAQLGRRLLEGEAP